jgi:hypothetical protein
MFNVNSCEILAYNLLGGHKSKHITLDILIALLQMGPIKANLLKKKLSIIKIY